MTDTSNPKVWAILIGINAYAEFKWLEGSVRDIENVEKVLKDSIDASRLEILKITVEDLKGDTLPTYDNIVGLIKHVQERATPRDFVYFHYSGHGGRQLRSQDREHPLRGSDNYFESLVLHGARHMKDYELGRYFDGLASAGAQLFAVLDCCHSGGGDRANHQNVRQIDRILPADPQPGEEEPDEEEDTGVENRAGSARSSYWTRVRNYTLLAACQPHQLAKECYDSDYKKNGALTLTMLSSLETLRQNGQSLTYKSLFWDICARIGMKSATQNPKLFGIEDRDVFSHDSHSSTRQAIVTSADSGRVYIDHGEIHGVKDGEKWAIYPRGALQLTKPITTITIDRVEAIKASGPLAAADSGNVDRGCPVSLVSPVYGTPLHVLVENDYLRQQLIKEPAIGVKLHGVDYLGAAYEIRPNDEGQHEIKDASGTHLPNSPVYVPGASTPTVSKIHGFLKTLAHYSRVLHAHNTKADLQGQFEFREVKNATTVCHGGSIELQFKNLRRLIPGTDDDRNRQNIRDTLYFSVLNLRADRTVTLCVPDDSYQSDGSLAVEPEKSSDELSIEMKILDTDGDVTEITDIFKVIVTDKPSSFRTLATEHAVRGGAAKQEDFNEEFQTILRGGSDGSRAGRLRPVDAKWQTAQVSVTTTRNIPSPSG
ncbi:uncharacterized protein TRUGW13939_06657 [Talaromyces rugulosus]|uniref:Peptidase C14 caspase domain-containing protein n=1 Tax=Talaromyces rugulosus TaxID=121627 RepID=A0A7H8R3S0_TALRU|nr:uncharacterized protein TRUGW13939_06657 [Talaromyces rugulosus]QKX59523.1 hypothetical protein TRUGW13939_06657 [Talaromyces rugulosus]